ncbi:MAG: hypothetical protein IH899_20795 [Planctomycetes bacterium]|nr:hypothetical protein [Planctomycetota bacterium]
MKWNTGIPTDHVLSKAIPMPLDDQSPDDRWARVSRELDNLLAGRALRVAGDMGKQK